MQKHIKKYKLLIFIVVIIVMGFWCYNHTAKYLKIWEKESFSISASNGEEFEMTYALEKFPFFSYSLKISHEIGRTNQYIFYGAGFGSKDVSIQFLFTYNNIDYYSAIKRGWPTDEEKIFAYSEGELPIIIEIPYGQIDAYSNLILMDECETEEELKEFLGLSEE